MKSSSRQRVREAIPWACFVIVILYGAATLRERGTWMVEVTDFMHQTQEDRWSRGQMVEFLDFVEREGRMPTPAELPAYDPVAAPNKPTMMIPDI